MKNESKSSKNLHGSNADKIFDIINTTLSILLLLIFIYPLYFVVIASISDPLKVWNGQVVLYPVDINFRGYEKILTYSDILIGYRNSIFYTLGSIVLGLVCTVSAAYPLSQKKFYIRNFIMKLYMFTMFFSGGMIPSYFVIKALGLIDSPLAVILPSAASFINIAITRTYFQQSIPDELREAAFMDGCSHFVYLFKIVLPLSKAIFAVMALFYGTAQWNAFFSAMIYLSNRKLYPLQLVLREILMSTQIAKTVEDVDETAISEKQKLAEVIKYGVIVVASLPVMLAYPFFQKYFVKGVMIGSLKG